jgi:mannose-1-phosphate guanylyltransferase/mannose-6-phosphate isomerase
MIIVINAGGSGTRLWPLSTPAYPKHLLALTGERTMLQSTFDRAKQITNDIYVVTEAGHAEILRKQLPELPDDAFIIEPARRGTANCIVMALEYISRHHDVDEPIAFIAADHQVRDAIGFKRSFEIAGAITVEKKHITLIGIEPTYNATGFGYIEKGEPIRLDSIVHHVKAFKEKPDFVLAKKFVESGRYLWNCSYFVGTINVFMQEMNTHAKELLKTLKILQKLREDSEAYQKTYLKLEPQMIEYALIEKVDELLVVPATFDWMDIGSFKDLHEANSSDEAGNFAQGAAVEVIEVENAFIRNEEDKPVVVIGLDNIVVVNTLGGLLVARKDMSQRVGDIAKTIIAKQQD